MPITSPIFPLVWSFPTPPTSSPLLVPVTVVMFSNNIIFSGGFFNRTTSPTSSFYLSSATGGSFSFTRQQLPPPLLLVLAALALKLLQLWLLVGFSIIVATAQLDRDAQQDTYGWERICHTICIIFHLKRGRYDSFVMINGIVNHSVIILNLVLFLIFFGRRSRSEKYA